MGTIWTRRHFCGTVLGGLAASSLAVGAARPRPVACRDIRIAGDLGHRAHRNFDRLETEPYQPQRVFESQSAKNWPGDWEGRTILGLTLLERSAGREARYLKRILAGFPAAMNDRGYFGSPLDPAAIDEQQLSGHGWVLRGLAERYEQTQDGYVLELMQKVVRNLALPTRGLHRSYPIDPTLRKATGGAAGSIAGQLGNWRLSSDVGCDFIFLDGVAHAATLLNQRPVDELVEEIIARFLTVDLAGNKAQTHASLTAIRGLIRWHSHTGDQRLLQAAIDRYALYRGAAMTETYANYNWFGRPTWSEPCAVIDSFLVTAQLWQYTGDPRYLEDAHHIWFNAIGRAQRANGGYGTDTCAGVLNPRMKVHLYEAFWCCTMRGGEGHGRSIEYCYFTSPGEINVAFYNDSVATLETGSGAVRLRQTTNYPYTGSVTLDVVASETRLPVRLRFFAPSWTDKHELRRNRKPIEGTRTSGWLEASMPLLAGDAIQCDFQLKVGPRDPLNPGNSAGYLVFEAGPLVLGANTPGEMRRPNNYPLAPVSPGVFRGEESFTLARLNDLNDLQTGEKDPCIRQVLFQKT